MENVHSALSLGVHGAQTGERLFDSGIGAISIAGITPSSAAAKATSMFSSGAKTGEGIAQTIYPGFTGEFKSIPLSIENARTQIDLLTEARGVPTIGTGTVFDTAGNEIKAASKNLWNANDHASAKAREATVQATEQLLGDILKIPFSESFRAARQTRLNLVNDPNFNNVIIDYLGNTGKGGVSLRGLSDFLVSQIDKTADPHMRGAYQQMLGDVLQGKYNDIAKELSSVTSSVKSPLEKAIHPTFLSDAADYVDDLRRKLINEADTYDEFAFNKDLENMKNAIINATKNVKNRRLQWKDVMNELGNISELF